MSIVLWCEHRCFAFCNIIISHCSLCVCYLIQYCHCHCHLESWMLCVCCWSTKISQWVDSKSFCINIHKVVTLWSEIAIAYLIFTAANWICLWNGCRAHFIGSNVNNSRFTYEIVHKTGIDTHIWANNQEVWNWIRYRGRLKWRESVWELLLRDAHIHTQNTNMSLCTENKRKAFRL